MLRAGFGTGPLPVPYEPSYCSSIQAAAAGPSYRIRIPGANLELDFILEFPFNILFPHVNLI
jgi:hypothetical protein